MEVDVWDRSEGPSLSAPFLGSLARDGEGSESQGFPLASGRAQLCPRCDLHTDHIPHSLPDVFNRD